MKTQQTLINEIYCTHISLANDGQEFTSYMDGYILPYHLKIHQSYIPEIQAGAFMKLANKSITVIKLGNNNIETIQPGAFNGLYSLEELYLQNNEIKVIARGVLNSLVNLQTLDISGNLVQEIEEHSFHGLKKMEEIILNSNRLKHLSQTIFASQKQMKYIDLSRNEFKVLPKMIFSNLTKLDTLLLNDNHLQVIDVETLNRSTNIKCIELSRNNITELNFPLPFWFEIINLGYNMINQIPRYRFSGWNNLVELNLTHNRIEFLVLGTFKDLGNLTSLDLSGNFLSDIKFGLFHGLQNLDVLKLNNNKLRQLPGQTFLDLFHLRNLDIAGNQLSISVIEDIVDHSKNLEKIGISSNSSCELLARLIKKLESSGIHVSKGVTYEDTNVHGIACKTLAVLLEGNDKDIIQRYDSPNLVNSYDIEKNLTNFSEKLNNINDGFKDLLKIAWNNEKSYAIFYLLLSFLLALHVIIAVLLYKHYTMTFNRRTDIYRVKFSKGNNPEFGNDIITM